VSSIRPASTGFASERIARLEEALRREEETICGVVIDENVPALTATSPIILGGIMIPWDRDPKQTQLRTLLPDARWVVWAAGWLSNPNGTATLGIAAQRDDVTPVLLGQQTFPLHAAFQKVLVGPYPARGPLALEWKATPSFQADTIQNFNVLGNVQTAGHTVQVRRWTMWVRMSAKET
jgi:hypothetical protein